MSRTGLIIAVSVPLVVCTITLPEMHLCVWLGALSLALLAAGQDGKKYTDENRPYKFGFNIEGHQHRKEEKDENGIIHGEYGFITADGYYRVTVYETDENDDFKIVSQKNYYVGFPPGDPTTTPAPVIQSGNPPARKLPSPASSGLTSPTPQSFQQTRPTAAVVTSTSTTTETLTTKTPPAQGAAACSSCFLPPTTKKPAQMPAARPNGLVPGRPNQPPSPQGTLRPNGFTPPPAKPQGAVVRPNGSVPPPAEPPEPLLRPNAELPTPLRPNARPNEPSPGQKPLLGGEFVLKSNIPDSFTNQPPLVRPGAPTLGEIGRPQQPPPETPNQLVGNSLPATNPKTPNALERLPAVKTNELQQNRVDNQNSAENAAINNDANELLYRFNYTVGFHGHHEDGFRNGDKVGDYFVNGRDGVSRKVEYVANEFGYQPNITLVNLDENDVRRPKEDTEKDYGLKGYEFKWFYRK